MEKEEGRQWVFRHTRGMCVQLTGDDAVFVFSSAASPSSDACEEVVDATPATPSNASRAASVGVCVALSPSVPVVNSAASDARDSGLIVTASSGDDVSSAGANVNTVISTLQLMSPSEKERSELLAGMMCFAPQVSVRHGRDSLPHG